MELTEKQISKIQKKPRRIEKFIKWLDDEYMIETAIYILCKLNNPRATEALLKAIDDPDYKKRAAVAYSLHELTDLRAQERALEALIKALKDSHPEVKRSAASSLGYSRDQRAINALLMALEDSDVQDIAARALKKMGVLPEKKDNAPSEMEVIRKYLHHLAVEWWNTQSESIKGATCDADGGRTIYRNEGYLIGSSLWCEDCYNSRAEEMIRRDPNSAGYGTLKKAMAMFGNK